MPSRSYRSFVANSSSELELIAFEVPADSKSAISLRCFTSTTLADVFNSFSFNSDRVSYRAGLGGGEGTIDPSKNAGAPKC